MSGRLQSTTLVRILLLAAAYFLAGKLGLLLAIPPGYATAIWLASGVAVVALLLFGSHLWPGILLGSFLVNVSIGYAPGNDLLNFPTIVTAAAIGIGAALQALLARYLIRRVVGFPLALRQDREISLFFLLAGPLACVTNATWGAGVLVGLERIGTADFALTWWTWWVGDTIGVFIVAPVAMSWLAEPRELWQPRRRSVALPMVVALLAVIAIFFYTSAREQERLQVLFEQDADSYADAFQRNLERYLEVLYAVRSFFYSSNEVTREEFRTFVNRHLMRNPGIHALSWTSVVSQQARKSLEAAARHDGIQDFQISEHNSDGELVAAAPRDRHVVVQYIEPLKTNRNALGFDVASNPDRRVALELARDTDRPVATARISLVQETGMQSGILVFLPVYSQAHPRGFAEPSQRVLRGYVTGAFRVGDMLHAAFARMVIGKFDLRLDDHSASGADEVLQHYTTGVGPVHNRTPTPPAAALSQKFRFDELGRDWSLHITESADQWTRQRGMEAWTVSAGGLLFTSLLGAFLLTITGRAAELTLINQRLQDEVRERKRAEAEIRNREARLSSIYTSANEAIFLVDPKHDQIIEVNPMALKMLEYSADEILRTPMSAIHPRETDKLRAFATEVYKKGSAVTEALTCTTKNGLVIPAEISASSLTIDGRPLMLAMVRDISERRRAQVSLQQAHDMLEQRVRERTTELIAAKRELEAHRDHLEAMVKERTRELEAANEEVRSFTYIVSHDMRAPLVNIKGFTAELVTAISQLQTHLSLDVLSQLDDEKRAILIELLEEEVPIALEFIEKSVSKLDQQINAILKLSRLGYRALKPEALELGPLIEELLNNFAHQLESTKTSAKLGEMPSILADRFAVQQIFGNLLDNAVKYLDKERTGEISVSAEQHNHEIIVHIQDNGRGIAATDQPKIFRIFQRAGLQDQPGEGMGLAYVYSLVRHIGGRIWCESTPGQGSRFSVAFPQLSTGSNTKRIKKAAKYDNA